MFFTIPLSVARIIVCQSAKYLKTIGALVIVCAAYPVSAAFPETDLRAYYRDLPFPLHRGEGWPAPTSQRPRAELIPRADLTGGGLGLTSVVIEGNTVRYVPVPRPYVTTDLVFFDADGADAFIRQYRESVCNGGLQFANTPTAGSSKTIAMNYWLNEGVRTVDLGTPSVYFAGEGQCDVSLPASNQIRRTTDELTFGAPVRRTAIDGSQYDASPMKLTRNGLPWYTHFFGYHLGLVANESNWDAANLSKAGDLVGFFRFPSPVNNFELTALPPPWVEDDVVEYVNKPDFPKQPGGQFFYAVLASDKTLLDSVPNWQRTGKAFKSGGYVSVCRFYGGKNGGPNTHFYSADDKECAALKAVPQLSYEGQTFAVNMPMPGSNTDGTKPCPIDSKPLYRLYNNASAPGKDYVSNHRYVTERTDVTAAVAQGWVDEGQVMCVPL